MTDLDKPKVDLTFSNLDDEETPRPFIYMTKANKRVTFPDLYDMEWEEGEAFLADMATKPTRQILDKWLTAADVEALKADRLSLRNMLLLTQKVQAHYEASLGTPGEGSASES